MSKIEELIRELCPDGVEYKPLGDLVDYYRGKGLSKTDKDSGETAIILYGELYTTYENSITDVISRCDNSIAMMSTLVQYGDLLLPISSTTKEAQIGKASILKVKEPVYLGGDAIALRPKCSVNSDYLMYYVNGLVFEKEKMKYVKGTTIRHLDSNKLLTIEVPIPPLPVQREIVRILDKFTQLKAEILAELSSEILDRRIQYEYYRNELLTFENDVPKVELGDICDVIVGGEAPDDCVKGKDASGDYIFPIWANGQDVYGYAKSYTVEKDAVCISSIGANTGAVFFHRGRFTPIIRLKVLIPKKDGINVRYLFHAVSIVNFAPKKSSVPNMSARDIKVAKIRLPSLEKQEEIAYLLDKFDDLTTSIVFGLQSEIEIRKKQYEFYRDKLLSFKRKEVS